VKAFNSIKGLSPIELREKIRPIVLAYNDRAIFMSNQLGMVNLGRIIHHPGYVIQTPDFGPLEELFQEAKRPVGCELRVSHEHEAHFNLLIKTTPHPPGEVLHDKP
jgi:hypothetical protein